MQDGEIRRGGVHPCPNNLGRGEPCPYVVLLIFMIIPVLLFSQSPFIADSLYKLGQYDSALVTYTQFITEHPEKKEGYYDRGLCYYSLHKLAEAQHDFNTCLQMDSVFDDARYMKILTEQKQGHWEGAIIEFKKLNTSYTGYNGLKKDIRYHNISVILSRNWYYMIAIMFLFIILVGILAKSYAVKKGI